MACIYAETESDWKYIISHQNFGIFYIALAWEESLPRVESGMEAICIRYALTYPPLNYSTTLSVL